MTVTRRHLLGTLASFPLLGLASLAQGQSMAPQKIGVIGSGRLGGTVGRLWVEAGHEVMFSSRNPDELKAMVERLRSDKASVGTPKDAAQFGSILLFATPYAALEQLGRDLSAEIQGKFVLDATNPSRGATDPLTRRTQSEGVGRVSTELLKGARLVRAFSAVDSWAIEESFRNQRPRMAIPIAGDDSGAIDVAAQLVRSAGCEPVVVGDLDASRQFDRGGPGWVKNTTAPELRALLQLPEQ